MSVHWAPDFRDEDRTRCGETVGEVLERGDDATRDEEKVDCSECKDAALDVVERRVRHDGLDLTDCPSCVLGPPQRGGCSLCGGKGEVRKALAPLYMAARSAGEGSELGPSEQAMGLYYLKRGGMEVQSVRAVKRNEAEPPDCVLKLYDEPHAVALALPGLTWGYRGAGPRALAHILADALPERFKRLDDAMEYVECADPEEDWEVRK